MYVVSVGITNVKKLHAHVHVHHVQVGSESCIGILNVHVHMEILDTTVTIIPQYIFRLGKMILGIIIKVTGSCIQLEMDESLQTMRYLL